MVNRNMYNTSLWLLHIHVSLLLMFEKRRLKQLSFDFTWEICHLLDITAVAGHLAWLAVLFHFVNLVIFRPQCKDSGFLVSATPHTILYLCFWNFAHVFSMVWRCAYGLDVILALIFVTFSTLRTLSFSDLRFYESVLTLGTLWAHLLIQFYTDLFDTLHMFSPWSGDVHVVWIQSLN